jgi:hypothetical protein
MSKMGSHCSFGHLKHKLWPKEGPGVELPGVCHFWLPTTKSRESTLNTWLQTTCDMPLESFRRELQLCFRSHFDPRSSLKVMGLQSPGSPSGRDFGTRESRESRERKAIWMWVPCRVTEYTIRWEGGGFPQVRAVMSLVTHSQLLEGLKCESKWKTAEEGGVGTRSLAHNTLRGREVCWSFGMGLGRIDKLIHSHGPAHNPHKVVSA